MMPWIEPNSVSVAPRPEEWSEERWRRELAEQDSVYQQLEDEFQRPEEASEKVLETREVWVPIKSSSHAQILEREEKEVYRFRNLELVIQFPSLDLSESIRFALLSCQVNVSYAWLSFKMPILMHLLLLKLRDQEIIIQDGEVVIPLGTFEGFTSEGLSLHPIQGSSQLQFWGRVLETHPEMSLSYRYQREKLQVTQPFAFPAWTHTDHQTLMCENFIFMDPHQEIQLFSQMTSVIGLMLVFIPLSSTSMGGWLVQPHLEKVTLNLGESGTTSFASEQLLILETLNLQITWIPLVSQTADWEELGKFLTPWKEGSAPGLDFRHLSAYGDVKIDLEADHDLSQYVLGLYVVGYRTLK